MSACDKRAFSSRRSARHAAKLLSSGTHDAFRAYPCAECRKWHLTTKRNQPRVGALDWDLLRSGTAGRRLAPGEQLEDVARQMRDAKAGAV